MSANTSIEWTDRTWNPTRGCSVISPGCHNCYAMKMAHRFSGPGKPYEGLTKLTERSGPQWTGVLRLVEDDLLDPLSWRKPRRVFVNSMSDLFHEDVPYDFIVRVFAVMALGHQHTYQVLTKRGPRMREVVGARCFRDDVQFAAELIASRLPLAKQDFVVAHHQPFPLPHVWLGVSVEDQKHADLRIPQLLQTPAAVRFISAEPLLGPVNLFIPTKTYAEGLCDHCCNGDRCDDPTHRDRRTCKFCRGTGTARKLDWVIVGGESGSGARPFDLAWARSIVQQCKAAGVACFVKQLGSMPMAGRMPHPDDMFIRLDDRKGGNPDEWPADLRVRQFPEVSA